MIQGVSRQETVNVEVTTKAGQKYTGAFTWKRPTMRDRARIAGMVTELADGRPVADPDLRLMVWMMAQLIVCTDTDPQGQSMTPPWFPLDFDEHDEPELLYLVYAKFSEWRDSFRDGAGARPADSDTPAGEGPGSVASGAHRDAGGAQPADGQPAAVGVPEVGHPAQ